MTTDHVALLRNGVDAYLSHYDGSDLEPSESFLPYDFEHVAERYQWRFLADRLVTDEYREVTNILNGWQDGLLRWHAWNRSLELFDENDAWELRREFVEACAHQCLLQPFSVRDALVLIATNAIHQIRLASEAGYRDHLEGDPSRPGERVLHLSRRRKEDRLARMTARWSSFPGWFDMLRRIDNDEYRRTTFDYRNRAAHAIAPRLAVGHVGFVTRNVEQGTEMVAQLDGSFQRVATPGKVVVSYGYGGTPPLEMEAARTANLEQYRRARKCFEGYRVLLVDVMAEMPLRRQQHS